MFVRGRLSRFLGVNMSKALFVVLICLFRSPIADAKVLGEATAMQSGFQIEQVAQGKGVIWGMSFLNPNDLLFTTRNGSVGIASIRTGHVYWLKNLPSVYAQGQGGLLDVAIPPNYSTERWTYFTYVKDLQGKGVTALAKAKLTKPKDALTQWQDVFVTDSATNTSRHFGSRIAFDADGHVFFTVGDRGVRPSAQDLKNHNGTVIRLNLDGSVPHDNPFVGKAPARAEIWSYGHRNPQGIVYDAKHNRLWAIEHGPRGGDEINLVQKGRNYGWPEISYGKEYWGPKNVADATHKDGMEQPHKVYTPSIAPGSLMLYQGQAFPLWKGSLFAGALKLRHINRVGVSLDGTLISEERLLEGLNERIRALTEGPDGFIYFSTDTGKIYRLKPSQ